MYSIYMAPNSASMHSKVPLTIWDDQFRSKDQNYEINQRRGGEDLYGGYARNVR